MRKKIFAYGFLLSVLFLFGPVSAFSASKVKIDIEVDSCLEKFQKEISGGDKFLERAKAILVFPRVLKAGFGIGGEYGKGALIINGNKEEYYSTVAGSIGFQVGAQAKSIVIVFLEDDALSQFRTSEGWKIGVDGSVALIKWGVGEDVNSIDIKDPIVGFVFGNQGLMYNLTIEGSKISRIYPK